GFVGALHGRGNITVVQNVAHQLSIHLDDVQSLARFAVIFLITRKLGAVGEIAVLFTELAEAHIEIANVLDQLARHSQHSARKAAQNLELDTVLLNQDVAGIGLALEAAEAEETYTGTFPRSGVQRGKIASYKQVVVAEAQVIRVSLVHEPADGTVAI